MSSAEVCNNYMTETFMLFIGGLIVAVAIEDSKLHERIALKVLLIIGTEFKWLMMGFMLTTMFLSMWMNNMSSTAMMVPIVEAVIEETFRSGDIEMGSPDPNYQTSNGKIEIHKTETIRKMNLQDSSELSNIKIALLLSVCYSSNIGGTGSLIGSASNMTLKGLIGDLYPRSHEITFTSWLTYSVPGMLLCTLVAWIYLWLFYIRKNQTFLKSESQNSIKEVISKKYDDLGSMSAQEIQISFLFLVLVFLWIFRDPKFITGWAELIGSDTKIGDSLPAILIAFLLFLLPVDTRRMGGRPLLEWKTAQIRVPWGIIILLGGGLSLADAAKKSGLSRVISSQLSALSVLPPVAIGVIMCFMTAMITEVMSNTAAATILLPVINEMATSIGVNPLYWMIPVTLACSYAFMLPIATPPNALVFESGNMKTLDMAKPGLVMNIMCCSIQLIMINTLGVALFDITTFPNWIDKAENLTFPVTMESHSNVTISPSLEQVL